VLRARDRAAAEEARALWRPPRTFDRVLDDPAWLALARELGSRRLARALGREVRRAAYAFAAVDPYGPARAALDRLVLRLALLALPAPEGDVGALLHTLRDIAPYRREESHFHDLLGKVPALAEAGRLDAMAERLACGGAGAAEALAWWRQLREASGREQQPPLRNHGFERGLRRLAARGAPPERDEALGAWLGHTPESDRSHLAGLWLGLFGPERGQLPEVLRCRVAGAVWGGGYAGVTEVETMLAWVEDLPPEGRAAFFRIDPGGFRRLCAGMEPKGPVWLLRLEDSDGRRAGAAGALLEAWATAEPGTELLRVLHHALVWLRPEVVEPLAARVLDAVPARTAGEALLREWFTNADAPRSYRLDRLLLRTVWRRLSGEQQGAFLAKLPAAEKGSRLERLVEEMRLG
jgi:hypothetical protein